MYMILLWKDDDNYLTCIKNENRSIKLFETVKEADSFANNDSRSDDMRVIDIEAVKNY